jgi:anti-anti-sigma factor
MTARARGDVVIVRAYTTVSRRGGSLVLLHVHARIRDLCQITRLIDVLEMFDSEDHAFRAVGGSLPAMS